MLSDEAAERIARFYINAVDDVEVLICQCEHGQSRSAAVATALLEYRSRRGIEIFADDRYYPNKVVFRKVLKLVFNTFSIKRICLSCRHLRFGMASSMRGLVNSRFCRGSGCSFRRTHA